MEKEDYLTKTPKTDNESNKNAQKHKNLEWFGVLPTSTIKLIALLIFL